MGVCITFYIVLKNLWLVIFLRLGPLIEPILEPQHDPSIMSMVLPLLFTIVFIAILLLDGICGIFTSRWTSLPQVTFNENAEWNDSLRLRKVLDQLV